MSRRAVVLYSGGLDSAVLLHFLLHRKWEVFPLFVDYGQRNIHREHLAAIRNLPEGHTLKEMSIFGYPSMGVSQDAPIESASPDVSYAPFRNTLLISSGLAYAESIGVRTLAAGFVGWSLDNHPDARPEYVRALQKFLRSFSCMRVISPFHGKSKLWIADQAARLGISIGDTWSCFNSGQIPCGICEPCQLRRTLGLDFIA